MNLIKYSLKTMKKNRPNSLNLVSSLFVKFIEFDFIFQPYEYVRGVRHQIHCAGVDAVVRAVGEDASIYPFISSNYQFQ
jgi:hypothetical protein